MSSLSLGATLGSPSQFKYITQAMLSGCWCHSSLEAPGHIGTNISYHRLVGIALMGPSKGVCHYKNVADSGKPPNYLFHPQSSQTQKHLTN